MADIGVDPGARRAILDATRALLQDPGSGDASLARIAARAGYSRQAIYRHFGSRAGLLQATLTDIDERGGALDAVARVRAAGDPGAELTALFTWWSRYVAGFAGVARKVYASRGTDAELAAAWDDRMAALQQVCDLVVGDCADAGVLRPELSRRAAAELLWGLMSIPLWDQLCVDRGWTAKAYAQRMSHTARAALSLT